jgi:hypothetical protein
MTNVYYTIAIPSRTPKLFTCTIKSCLNHIMATQLFSPLNLMPLHTFLAGLLASALWDKSVVILKQCRIRFIINTFTVLDGIYKRISDTWIKLGDSGQEWLQAIRIIQSAMLEEMRRDRDVVESLVKVASAFVEGNIQSVPANFLPIQLAGV